MMTDSQKSLISYYKEQSKYELISGAIVGAALFCGFLALMLAYFDVLTK